MSLGRSHFDNWMEHFDLGMPVWHEGYGLFSDKGVCMVPHLILDFPFRRILFAGASHCLRRLSGIPHPLGDGLHVRSGESRVS